MFARVHRSRGPILVFAAFALSLLGGCRSQSPPERVADPIAEPHQMIADGRYAEAVKALDAHLERVPADGEALYWRGVSHHRLGHVDHALQDYSAAIRADFVQADVFRARGELYAQQKLGELAALDFEDALRLQRPDAETLCRLADACMQAKRPDRALVAARQAIRLRPNYVAAYRALGAAAQDSPSDDYTEAIGALQRAHHLDRDNPDIKKELAAVYCRQAKRLERIGETTEANTYWQLAAGVDPQSAADARRLAQRRAANGRQTVGYSPNYDAPPPKSVDIDEEQLRRRIDDLLAANNIRTAIDELTAAMAKDPESPLLFVLRGRAFCAERSYESAIADYTEAIRLASLAAAPRLDATVAEAHALRGRAYRLIKNPSGAIYDLTEAMRLDPSRVDAYLERGKAYFDLARYDLALADYAGALKRDPNQAESIHQAEAQTYLRLGQQQIADSHWDEAVTHFERAEKLDPTLKAELKPRLAEALRGRALMRAAAPGQTDAALADANRALALDGQNAQGFDTLARVQVKRGEWSAAIESLRTAMQLDPPSAGNLRVTLGEAYRGWGDALAAAGRYAEALPHLSRAVDLAPLNGRHVLARGQTYYYLGRFAEARDDFNTALRRAPELDPQVSPYLDETNRRLGIAQASWR